MKKLLTISLAFAGIHAGVLSAHAAFTRLATETYPGGGGGPTGGVTKAYVDAQDLSTLNSSKEYTDLEETRATTAEDGLTSALAAETLSRIAGDETNAAAIVAASVAATNYTDSVTNALLPLVLVRVTTNDFVNATNDIWLAITHEELARIAADETNAADIVAAAIAATNYVIATSNDLAAIIGEEEYQRKLADNKRLTIASPSYPDTRQIKWVGYDLYVMGGFRVETWDSIKAGTVASTAEKLPAYLKSGAWNTAADPFAKKSDLSGYLPLSAGSSHKLTDDLCFQNGDMAIGSQAAGIFISTPSSTEKVIEFSAGEYTGSESASTLTIDYTPVVTSNMLNGVLARYLPLDGSKKMTGDLSLNKSSVCFMRDDDVSAQISPLSSVGGLQFFSFGTSTTYDFFDHSFKKSSITPDDTPVLTAKKAETDYPAITNSYPFALGNMVSNTVSQWDGYWNGSNVYWSVTNYLESGNAKVMKLYEIQTNGVHREIWNDSDKYDIFFTNTLDAVASTNTFTREWVGTFVTNSLDAKADRAWGKYTSAGYDVPDTNMVWHTAPTTVFAGGFEFQKVAVAGGEIGVLVSQGAVPYAAGAEGKFIIGDGFGTNYFGYVKKDDYIIATRVDGITVDQATKMVTLTYDLVFSGEYPIVYYSPTVLPVTAQTWIQLNKIDGTLTPGAPWPVTFSTGAGYIKAHISFASSTPSMPPDGFFTSSTAVIGGGTFKTNMKADFLDAGIMCTNTDTKVMGVIRPTFDGTTVHWNWSKQ